ncbi:MAG: aminopeptidase P family protein [Betaproteobacteria bacterium]|nr:aminopeptidase P family protein [Betaproteobacteria bacterium]
METRMQSGDERICNPVSDAELARRWTAARATMREQGIAALVIGGSANPAGGYFRWFADQPSTSGNPRTVIFPLEGEMTVVEHGPTGGNTSLDGKDPAYRGIGRRLTTPSHLWSTRYTSGQDAELVAGELKKAGCTTVGLVGQTGMYYGFCMPLRTLLADAKVNVVDATDAIDRLKAIKSPEEIVLIRRAAAMQDDIIARVGAHIRPGMREFEVSAYAEYLGHLAGSDQGIFLGSSAPPGRAAGLRTRTQQGRQLREGDTYTLLVENNGPGGFYTEIMRTYVLGKPSQELVDAFGTMLEAQQHTLKALKPGTPAAEAFAAHNAFMRARGLPEERRLHSHGQGYDLVERPLLRPDEPMTIEENMNFVAHPGYGNERIFAVICDNYLIGPDGPGECLHRTPQRIIEL